MAHSRSILITGASKGIGKGIARAFAAHGDKVALVARDIKSLDDTVAEITAAGGVAIACQADVSDSEAMAAAVKTTLDTFGAVDVLVANAGIFPSASLATMTGDDWDKVMNTNLKGTFISVQAAMVALKQSIAGRIVVTSSITGPITGFPGWAHYGASKAGQLGFIRTASIELAKNNITINAVMPGNILTEGLAGMGEGYLNKMAASIPLKRLGSVDDIAHAVMFFASREAGYITGQTLVIDGGQTLPESMDALA